MSIKMQIKKGENLFVDCHEQFVAKYNNLKHQK